MKRGSGGRVDEPATDPVRSGPVVRRLAVAAVVLSMGTGCRSKPAPSPPATGPLVFDDDASAPASDSRGEDRPAPAASEVEAGGCKAGGVAWDGKHDGCLYEVAGCCYGDAQSACQAAGCEGKGCQVLESAPAQIVCHPG